MKDDKTIMLKAFYNECILMLHNIGYFPQVKDIRLNNRLSRTYGRYLVDERIVELNANVFENASEEQIKTIILHELCHNLEHIQYGEINYESEGHSDSWKVIADDVTQKLGFQIQRYSPFTVIQKRRSKNHCHTYKCTSCGCDKTVYSKYQEIEKVRHGSCIYCGSKDLTYLFNGQYAFDFRSGKRIILLDK